MEYRELGSGLVTANYGMDATALERELRKRDSLLSLQGTFSPAFGAILWRVVRHAGEGGPETVLVWGTNSEAFPLSSGLLDELDRHDRNSSRRDYKDEDELERQRKAARERQTARDDEALRDDWIPKHGRPVLPRSQSLRRARDKRRAEGEKC